MRIEELSSTINRAIDHFGKDSQISKAIEEMGELIVELAKSQNGQGITLSLIDEIADVSIMIAQLREIFGANLVDSQMSMKLRRLRAVMDHMDGIPLK